MIKNYSNETKQAVECLTTAIYDAAKDRELTNIVEGLAYEISDGDLCMHFDEAVNPTDSIGDIFGAFLELMQTIDIEVFKRQSAPEPTSVEKRLDDLEIRIGELEKHDVINLADRNNFLETYNDFLEKKARA